MPQSNSKKILVVISVIFILLIAFNIFWFNFIKSESEKVTAIKESIKLESVNGYTVTQIKKEIRELKEKEEELDKIFIDKDNVVIFIEMIERIAEQNNVVLQIQNASIESVLDADKKELHNVIKMVLSTSGNWANVTSFLKTIETIPYNVSIDSLNLGTFNAEGGNLWSLNLSITGIAN